MVLSGVSQSRFCYIWRASEASETLSSLNNKNQRYMLLASERREYQYILNEE